MRTINFILVAFVMNILPCVAQNSGNNSIKILTQKKGVSIRALSVPNNKTIWASGSNGAIALSTNGGDDFEWKQVKGFERRDFRALHAWDNKEAIIVAVGAPAIILKTKDAGSTWYRVYENADTLMFLDAIHFKDDLNGTIVGDPINNFIFLLQSVDKGEHWNRVGKSYFESDLKEGEAFFASSNSNLKENNTQQFLVSGGMASRLWINGKAMDIPILQGAQSRGANSMAIAPNGKSLMIVGGDFMQDSLKTKNIVGLDLKINSSMNSSVGNELTTQWELNNKLGNPNGYRSCILFINKDLLITCGTSGVDISKNKGQTWELISNESFHVVQKQPNRKKIFLAGAGGRIGKISMN